MCKLSNSNKMYRHIAILGRGLEIKWIFVMSAFVSQLTQKRTKTSRHTKSFGHSG